MTAKSGPGYAKKPEHRISVRRVSGNLAVWAQGRQIAGATQWLELSESHYPPAHYVHTRDVRMDWMSATATDTYCPFKGHASYWRLEPAPDGTAAIDDVLWGYLTPYQEVIEITNHVAFYPNRVERIEVEINE